MAPRYRLLMMIILPGALILALILAGPLSWPNFAPNVEDSAQTALGASPFADKKLAVLTSLPLFLPEALDSADLLNASDGHPLGDILMARYASAPHDVLQAALDETPDMLLLAQARALSPEELVRLDDWVRAGGTALIFADPLLEWPSIYPFADPRRPEGTTLLSPLFARWGLELRIDEAQPQDMWRIMVDGQPVSVIQAGHFVSVISETGDSCQLLGDGLVADCRIGKGAVRLVADADMLQPQYYDASRKTGLAMTLWIDQLISK